MSVPAQQMLQKVKVPATKALAAELLARVQEVPFLEEKGYYVFSELDVTRQTRFETFPVVAIAYAGLTVIDRSPDSNPNCGRRATDTDAIFCILFLFFPSYLLTSTVGTVQSPDQGGAVHTPN